MPTPQVVRSDQYKGSLKGLRTVDGTLADQVEREVDFALDNYDEYPSYEWNEPYPDGPKVEGRLIRLRYPGVTPIRVIATKDADGNVHILDAIWGTLKGAL